MKTLFLVVAAFAWVQAPILADPHSAIDPKPRDNNWRERHNLINRRVAETGAKCQVIFIGDSITQGWEGSGREVWARYYAPRHALNLGIGGDRTQHVLWRLENGNLQGLQPRAAVLMIGTNNSNGEDNTVEQIAEGITAIVHKLRTALPDTKILLLAIFPRSENPTPQRGKLLLVNQIVRRLADEQNVFWIDFGHQFLEDDGRIPARLMPDYLHLSPDGYAIWAEAIEDRLAAVLGDARVRPAGGDALAGSWTWTITGPDGNPVEAPLVLEQDGGKVSGRFARGEGRWLNIENGTVTGNAFSWTVRRDRPDGGTMTYRMSGTVDGDRITGQVITTFDGSEVTSDWSARRN